MAPSDPSGTVREDCLRVRQSGAIRVIVAPVRMILDLWTRASSMWLLREFGILLGNQSGQGEFSFFKRRLCVHQSSQSRIACRFIPEHLSDLADQTHYLFITLFFQFRLQFVPTLGRIDVPLASQPAEHPLEKTRLNARIVNSLKGADDGIELRIGPDGKSSERQASQTEWKKRSHFRMINRLSA